MEIVKTPTGYYVTFIQSIGYLRADTLKGLKQLIKREKENKQTAKNRL